MTPVTSPHTQSVPTAPEAQTPNVTTAPEAPDGTAPTRTGRARRSWFVAGVVLIVALTVVVAFALALVTGRLDGWPGRAKDPAATVSAYLTAVASGDAVKALSLAENPAVAEDWLSPEFAQRTAVQFPLVDINVEPATASAAEVTVMASYRIGPESYRQPFLLVDRNGWKLARATSTVTVTAIPAGLGLELNGKSVRSGETFEVLPGHYEVTEDLELLDVDRKLLQVSGTGLTLAVSVHAVLPEAGRGAVKDAVTDSLAACIAQKALSPAGCPNRYDESVLGEIDPSTIEWTITSARFNGEPELQPSTGLVVTGTADLILNLSARVKLIGTIAVPLNRSLNVRAGYLVGVSQFPVEVTWTD